MSTNSTTDFDWSVKIEGKPVFNVGIASQIKPEQKDIYNYDQNAIMYTNYNNSIKVGKEIHSELTQGKIGDIIRFRFQPNGKKLVIDSVRS